jgi:5-oxoprolinase (ATP-hydrolysing) subunit A
VLEDADEIARRCVAIATGEPITDIDGGSLTITAGSICVHGDTAGAVDIARSVKDALTAAGVSVASFVT